MAKSVSGKFSEIIWVQLDGGQDLLQGIKDTCREHNIKTGVVIDITGGLTKARLQKFKKAGDHSESLRIGVVDIEGPLEATGHGIIGMTRGTGGIGGYVDGDVYVHVHMVVTTGGDNAETLVGHLMPGTFVRSHLKESHFEVVLGKMEGVELTAVIAKSADGKGRILHELEQK